jgi:hypothetical protein
MAPAKTVHEKASSKLLSTDALIHAYTYRR